MLWVPQAAGATGVPQEEALTLLRILGPQPGDQYPVLLANDLSIALIECITQLLCGGAEREPAGSTMDTD